jgi:hypothetical protein
MGNLFHLGGNKDWKDDIFGLNLIFTWIKMIFFLFYGKKNLRIYQVIKCGKTWIHLYTNIIHRRIWNEVEDDTNDIGSPNKCISNNIENNVNTSKYVGWKINWGQQGGCWINKILELCSSSTKPTSFTSTKNSTPFYKVSDWTLTNFGAKRWTSMPSWRQMSLFSLLFSIIFLQKLNYYFCLC